MSAGKFFVGVLSGLAAGAMLGVLFAPEKGKVTRKKIYRKGEDVKDKFDEFIDEISERFDDVKDNVSDIAEKGKAKFNQTAKNFKTVK